jgi:hypothetical protein
MTNKKVFLGMLSIVLTVGFVLMGCDTGVGGNSKAVRNLPSFDGAFVASEQEATTLAIGADVQIRTAIATALAQGPSGSLSAALAAVNQNGHYSYNGISLDYTVSVSNNFGKTYPGTMNEKENITINGTYGGYKISGSYNVVLDYTYTALLTFNCNYKYDCVYAVSHNGKGMKVITTGNMTVSSLGSPTYNLHYAVYDNNNVEQYNYDHK